MDLPGVARYPETDQEILARLVEVYAVPSSLKFKLLNRIRVARLFGTLHGRRQLVRTRLLAFYVLFQVWRTLPKTLLPACFLICECRSGWGALSLCPTGCSTSAYNERMACLGC